MDVISHPAATASDIRLAHRRDAGQLKQIAELAYAKYVPRMHKPPAPFFYDYAAIADEGMTHVLERDGKVVAMVTLAPQPDHLLLRNLAILPEYQKSGIGRVFLVFAEDMTRRLGLTEIRLWTNEKMAENVPYYLGLGYRITHRAVVDGYSRIFMSKPVENVSAATTDPSNPAAPAGTTSGDYILRDAAELDEKFDAVPEHVRARQMNRLDQHCRRFISLSPFMVLGTSDGAAGADVSPRGDAPGFVQILDDRTLAIPDRPGNNRLDSMRNILRHPVVGLLFLIPGVEESLRINGSALLSRDPARLAAMAISGRQPTIFIQVAIREVYLHCGKALRRSRLWTGEYQIDRGVLPSLGQMTADQIGANAAERALIETKIADNYANRLY